MLEEHARIIILGHRPVRSGVGDREEFGSQIEKTSAPTKRAPNNDDVNSRSRIFTLQTPALDSK